MSFVSELKSVPSDMCRPIMGDSDLDICAFAQSVQNIHRARILNSPKDAKFVHVENEDSDQTEAESNDSVC